MTKPNAGKMYFGLTDDLVRRWEEHGKPPDFDVRQFVNESSARTWEQVNLMSRGTAGGPGGEGWQYGYTYTVTVATKE